MRKQQLRGIWSSVLRLRLPLRLRLSLGLRLGLRLRLSLGLQLQLRLSLLRLRLQERVVRRLRAEQVLLVARRSYTVALARQREGSHDGRDRPHVEVQTSYIWQTWRERALPMS